MPKKAKPKKIKVKPKKAKPKKKTKPRTKIKVKPKQATKPKKQTPKRKSATKKFDLKPFVAKEFTSNQDAWKYVLVYFRENLPMILAQSREPQCVVFDIDHTVTIPYPDHREITSLFVLPLYNLFRFYKIPIYFVTARPLFSFNMQATKDELAHFGFIGYAGLAMIPPQTDVRAFKLGERNRLRQTYNILFNVGDEWTDLTAEPVPSKYTRSMLLRHLEPRSEWSLKLVKSAIL